MLVEHGGKSIESAIDPIEAIQLCLDAAAGCGSKANAWNWANDARDIVAEQYNTDIAKAFTQYLGNARWPICQFKFNEWLQPLLAQLPSGPTVIITANGENWEIAEETKPEWLLGALIAVMRDNKMDVSLFEEAFKKLKQKCFIVQMPDTSSHSIGPACSYFAETEMELEEYLKMNKVRYSDITVAEQNKQIHPGYEY